MSIQLCGEGFIISQFCNLALLFLKSDNSREYCFRFTENLNLNNNIEYIYPYKLLMDGSRCERSELQKFCFKNESLTDIQRREV